MSASDYYQKAFEAGKRWRTSGAYYESGVSNANVVKYGFHKWLPWDRMPEGVKKTILLKSFREGYQAGVRSERGKRNPALKLPSKFTPAEVRVNEQGKVQIRINPAKLGSGGRVVKGVQSVQRSGARRNPSNRKTLTRVRKALTKFVRGKNR